MAKVQGLLSRDADFSGVPYRITKLIGAVMPDMVDGDQLRHGAVSRFCRLLDGVAPQRISGMLERDMPCKADLLDQLHKRFGTNLNWLVSGTGPMFVDRATEELAGELMQIPPRLREHTMDYIRRLAEL